MVDSVPSVVFYIEAVKNAHSARSVCIRVIRGIRVLFLFDCIGTVVHGGCVGVAEAPGF